MKFVRLTTLLSVLLLATSAGAVTLTLDDCDSQGCAGSDVSLSVLDNGNGTYNITLGLDSTGYTEGDDQDGVVQAGFKAIRGASSISLQSFSDGSWSSAKFAGISSNSLCSGPGEPDFGCTSGYANVETNKVYTWDFLVTGGTMLDIDDWAIKFQYCDSTDERCNGKIISAHGDGDPGTPVPEPSAALVFAGGMLIAATRLRRRR